MSQKANRSGRLPVRFRRNAVSVELPELLEDGLIRRAEGVGVHLPHRDPAEVIVLQLPGLSLRDGGVKEGEMHRQIRIDVGEFCEDLPHPDGDAQLLPALPDQGFLFGLPRFHLTAHELPEESPGLVGGPLAGQEPVSPPDQRRHHLHGFRHKTLLPRQKRRAVSVKCFSFTEGFSAVPRNFPDRSWPGTPPHSGRGCPAPGPCAA